MKILFALFISLSFSISCLAQSDLLILKKNGRTQRTFFPGSEISFTTSAGNYTAFITSIEKDSVFLIQYDIRQVPTNLGVYVLDTVARYRFGINYHDITAFGKDHNKFNWNASGGALFGGGILLSAVGLGTWIFTKPDTRYYASPALVIGSAALAGVGYLMMKSYNKGMPLGKKYQLIYIKTK
jgi:hypothetical protein